MSVAVLSGVGALKGMLIFFSPALEGMPDFIGACYRKAGST